jgi:hypothetical protein
MDLFTDCRARSQCTAPNGAVVCNIAEGAQSNPACGAGLTCTVTGTPSIYTCR